MKRVYKDFLTFFEKTSFEECFIAWVIFMFIFGGIYFVLSYSPQNAIYYQNKPLQSGISGFITAQYFSFITSASASQGYGDIVPNGISRIFAVIEAVSGLILFGILISKLVSSKQEIILEEVYDMSYEEKMNRLRSGLYLFRSDANKVIDKVLMKQITKRQLLDLWLITVTLDTSLHDINKFLLPTKKGEKENKYLKTLDPLRLELLLNSIELSLAKLHDLMVILTDHEHDWRNLMTLESINSIINSSELIYGYYKNKNLEDIKVIQKLDAIRTVNNAIRDQIAATNVHIAQQLNLKTFHKQEENNSK